MGVGKRHSALRRSDLADLPVAFFPEFFLTNASFVSSFPRLRLRASDGRWVAVLPDLSRSSYGADRRAATHA